ncbi:MAG: IS66 family transposase [Alloprevotella sp.]|nr:IS66 family transposase [Bacteroidales bacterium]MDY2914464.1 IS66 family transposase [Alloprevotella sp.]MDY4874353.1 IS66 family transposase [Alloprevotella sp.]
MKEAVTDIYETLLAMTEEVRLLRETIGSQHTDICRLNRNIDKLNADLRKRDKRIKELEEKLAKYETPNKNSGNSNTPPSKENIKAEVIRRTKTLRKPTGRKPGGQEGHEGCTLKKAQTPDETEDIMANYCTRCGASLEDCERILDYVTQVVSIPELKPIVKEIRHYIMVCKKCGERIQLHAARKRGSNAVVYDASVKSLVVYLSVVMFLPYGRIESFLREVFSLEISQGSLVNWVNEAKKNAAPAIKKIKESIMKSAVVGFDESGLYCNKKLNWAWIAQTVYFTLLFHGNGRSHKELESRFGDSLERMVAVTDRHSAYFTLNFLNHQVCVAHLLRELQYLNELDAEQQWSRDVESLLQQAIHERNENPQAVIDKQPWLIKLDRLLTENLEHMAEQFGKLKNGLIKCRDYIFNFLENPAIPPDNNASERGIRKVKIKMKNSGTFRSDQGADAFLDLLSIIETTKKHNKSPYAAIRALF